MAARERAVESHRWISRRGSKVGEGDESERGDAVEGVEVEVGMREWVDMEDTVLRRL